MKKIGLGLALLALLSAIGCTQISPGHVGIVVDMQGKDRGVQSYTTTTGWVTYMPGKTQILEYPTFIQTVSWTKSGDGTNKEADESLTFQSKEGISINTDVNLSYSLRAEQVPNFYVKFRTDDLGNFTNGFLRNVARDAFIALGSQYSTDEIYSTKKGELLERVRTQIESQVSPYGVHIEQFGLFGELRLPPEIRNTINSKVAAIQKALQAQNELAATQAEAAKRVAAAEGEAKANDALTRSITPTLVEWRRLDLQQQAIQKWNGTVPQVSGGGGTLPFMLNMQKP